MPAHIQHLSNIARHRSDRTGRTTWTTNGQIFTGRGAHLKALRAARAADRLSHLLRSVHRKA